MPAVKRKSSILAPNGQPVSYYLYPSPRNNLRAYKPRYWLQDSTRKNVSEYDRKEMVNYARQLSVQIDVLETAITQKNNWAFGDAWDPHYTGRNAAWGEAAQSWLTQVWFPNCNVRGPQYDFKTSMWLSGWAWDVDGDDVMVLTETASGFPMLAFYPATKISSGKDSFTGSAVRPETEIQSGDFKGARMFDGIIMDRNARAIGLRIIGEEAGDFQDVSAFNADLAYEPRWNDQGRGIPRVAVSSLTWFDYQDIQEFTKAGVKRASNVGLIIENAEGEATNDANVITADEIIDNGQTPTDGGSLSDRKVAIEELGQGGETYYLSSSEGEKIVPLNFKNPHPNTEAFIERMTRGAISSVGWFAELLDLKSTGRAPSRILVDLANQSIWARQRTGYRRWKRAIGYAIAKAMKIGQIPRNDDGFDPYLWEPGLPKPLQVDAGNDAQADRESLKLGTTTEAILAQKNHGLHRNEIKRVRAQEIRDNIATAKAISGETGLPLERCLELLEQRSPNPIAQQQQQKAQAAPGQSAKAQANAPLEINMRLESDKSSSRKSVKFNRAADGSLTGAEVTEE